MKRVCGGQRGMALAIVLLLAALPCLAAEDYRAALSEGDAFTQRLDSAGALTAYEKAYQIDPASFEALEKVTRASIDLGNEMVERKSKDAERYFREAIQDAELMRQKFPNRAESYFYLAASYGSLSLLKDGKDRVTLGRDVEVNARKAIAINPRYAPAYTALGVFYREVANLNWLERAFARRFYGPLPQVTFGDAENMLRKALQIDPSSVYTHYQLALTYELAGDRSGEVKTLREMADLTPVNPLEADFKAEARSKLQQLKG